MKFWSLTIKISLGYFSFFIKGALHLKKHIIFLQILKENHYYCFIKMFFQNKLCNPKRRMTGKGFIIFNHGNKEDTTCFYFYDIKSRKKKLSLRIQYSRYILRSKKFLRILKFIYKLNRSLYLYGMLEPLYHMYDIEY